MITTGKQRSLIIEIDRSNPFNPTTFIDKDWSIKEEDECSLALSKVDLAKVELVLVLKNDDRCVYGEERLRRLKEMNVVRLDAKVLQTLWDNKGLIPESWKGKSVYFDGTILRDSHGIRCVLSLYQYGDGEWSWSYCWLLYGWGVGDPSAVLAK